MNKNPNNNFRSVKSEELSALDTASKQGSKALSKIPTTGSLQEAIKNYRKSNTSNKK